MKRARPEEAPEAAGTDESNDEPFPWETQPSKYLDGTTVVKLKFVGTLDEAAKVSTLPTHSVEFVHQIFDNQGAIECSESERPLQLEVVYSASTLDVCHKLDPTKASTGVADSMMRLAAALPSPAEESYSDLVPMPGWSPAGKLAGDNVASYTLPAAGPGATFEIYAAQLGADAPAERLRFAERLQTIFRFCIETSEPIDATNDSWSLITIFERKDEIRGGAGSDDRVMSPSPPTYRLVAASTVYRFQRFIAGQGFVPLVRICQAATLPPFRGQGHGSRMLQAIYTLAKESVDAREVTVEDPNDDFRLLRDLVDYRNCVEGGFMKPKAVDGSPPPCLAPLRGTRRAARHRGAAHPLLRDAAVRADRQAGSGRGRGEAVAAVHQEAAAEAASGRARRGTVGQGQGREGCCQGGRRSQGRRQGGHQGGRQGGRRWLVCRRGAVQGGSGGGAQGEA